MLSMVKRYGLVVKNKEVVAVCTYRYYHDETSFKGILIGGNYEFPDVVRKTGVKLLIKYMIVNWDKLYWIECSGAVDGWFKKYGGIMIPNELVPDILKQAGLSPDIDTSEDRGIYWYQRLILPQDKMEWKRMYGFHDKKFIDKILDDAGVNKITTQIKEKIGDELYHALKESIQISFTLNTRYTRLRNTLIYIDDVYYNCGGFKLISQELYDVLKGISEEGYMLLKHLDLNEEKAFDFRGLLETCDDVLYDANLIVIHRYF